LWYFEYVIGFIILLGVLIFVHEFGHFIVAKAAGVKVLKFSLGFPPAMIKRTWGETDYMLSWVPLGGYVKLLGEDPESDEEVPPEEIHRSFTSKPLYARAAIIAAGPVFNYLLAVVLLCSGYLMGLPVLASEIGTVVENSPAAIAGVDKGDLITAVDGKPIQRWDEMRSAIEQNAGKNVTLTVDRQGKVLDLKVMPQLSDQKDFFGRPLGRIGVTPSGTKVSLGVIGAISEGVRFTGHLTWLVVETVVKLLKGEVSAKALSGPITIVQASGESLRQGLFSFLFLMSFISINLAIINLLPVPILDGGHLMFFLVEAIIRRPVTGRVRQVATQLGLLFIIFLMVLVFYNDISRIATQGWSLTPP